MKAFGYAPQALRDLSAIGRYIGRDNPARARSYTMGLRAHARKAAERPLIYPTRDEVRPGLRSIAHHPYTIFFRDLEEEVRIVRIVHMRQDIRSLTFD